MKVDMSPKAITARLRKMEELWLAMVKEKQENELSENPDVSEVSIVDRSSGQDGWGETRAHGPTERVADDER